VKDFRKQKAWEKSHQLTLAIYKASEDFPREELYGLTSQIRRASSSIPANIAEGCGKNGEAELARFFQMARGSASELEYHLLLARDLDFLPVSEYERLTKELGEMQRMLASFINKLKAQSSKLKAQGSKPKGT
jgi:four helix bundle protein